MPSPESTGEVTTVSPSEVSSSEVSPSKVFHDCDAGAGRGVNWILEGQRSVQPVHSGEAVDAKSEAPAEASKHARCWMDRRKPHADGSNRAAPRA